MWPVVAMIASSQELSGLLQQIDALLEVITSQEPDAAAKHIAAFLPQAGVIAGARSIRSKLSKVRRALRERSPDKAKALERLDVAMKSYQEELAWRRQAAGKVLGGLSAYEQHIRNTTGLRKQTKLPSDQAVEVAARMAYHRDISLHF